MPTAVDAPEILIDHLETPSPFTELGTKGMGEAPIISSKAVIVSAIEDALSPFHVRISELRSPEKDCASIYHSRKKEGPDENTTEIQSES